jgi:uncharacterized SAM-binding protein YcdF (DUF218 family)
MKRWLRRLFRLLILTGMLYLLAALVLALAGMQEDAQTADVAVVFGNKVEPWGEPSPSLASRLDKAVELYQRGLFPVVIVSGGVGKEGWDEAEVMAAYLIARGIPGEAVLRDSQGNNTLLTAQNTAVLAQAYDFHSFVLITHFYHLPRARLTFQRLGLTPVYMAHANRFVARDFYYGLMREVIAFPVYWVRAKE